MPRVNFPAGILGSEKLPRTRRELRNCFNNLDNRILARPGIDELQSSAPGTARGSFVFNDALYIVAGQSLIKTTNSTTAAFTTVGTISGGEAIAWAIGFNEAVIVVKGSSGAIYSLDTSDTLTLISGNANFQASRDVCHINGRFVYIPFNGDPAFFSDVGDAGTVQATSFFDAEELPDDNKACFNFRNTLYICGTDSIELFRDTGATPNPFGRIQGARIQNGFIAALLEYNETFLFIGREKDQDVGIYAIGQGPAPKISNEAIDLDLAGYTEDEMSTAVSGRFKWRGYDIATFTLSRNSWGFFGGNWFNLDRDVDGFDQPWLGGYITQYDGKYFSASEDKIGVFGTGSTDYGEKIVRIVDTAFEQEDNEFFGASKLELGISQGFSTTDGTVALQLSNDNVTYSQPVFRDLGDLGEYAHQLIWNYPGGLGRYHGFMGIRLYTTGDLDFNLDYISIEFAA